MNFLVFGAGMMANGLIFDLTKNKEAKEIVVVDRDQKALDNVKKRFSDKRVECVKGNIDEVSSLARLLKAKDCAINATHYKYNYDLSRLCIEAGVNFCDMGGNNDVVSRQFTLSGEATRMEVSVLPDLGLAPGMAGLAALRFCEGFDELDTVKIRVGGVPLSPDNKLGYQLVFSVEGLINEYMEKALILKDGKELEVESMSGLEYLDFPAPYGRMEAFYTSGGISTLTKTLKGKVKNLDYKTLRYPGHCDLVSFLIDLGLASSKDVELKGLRISPRRFLGKILSDYLPSGRPDAVLVRIEIEGKKKGRDVCIIHEMIDEYDPDSGLSAMQRTTAFPVSIIAQMLASGKISKKGVLKQEESVPRDEFMKELENRGIRFKNMSCVI